MKARTVRPEPRNKPRGGSGKAVDVGNPSSGSHWQHDAAGPSRLVTPGGETGPSEADTAHDAAFRVTQALAAQLATQCDWQSQRIRVEQDGRGLVLEGSVTSDVIARAAERCARAETDLPVRNALTRS